MKKPENAMYAEFNSLLKELARIKAEIQTLRLVLRRYYESQSRQTDKPQGGDKHERI